MMGYMLFPMNPASVSPVCTGGDGVSRTFDTTWNNTTHAAVRGT
jgi:hypothetical protein